MEVRESSARYLAKPEFKQTELGLIPSDWELRKLGDLASFKTGPFGSALHRSDYVDDGIPVVNPMQIIDGRIVPTSTMAISEEAARKLADFRLSAGDIVIGRRGDMGRCAVVRTAESGWLCGTGSMIIRCKSSLDAGFAQRELSSPAVVAEIENNSVGTTMINLNQGTLRNLLIPCPSSVVEQQAIATALSDADALIESLEQLLAKKRQIKQGAMQELLTGKRRLPGFVGEWANKPLGELAFIQRGASPRPIDSPVWFDENSSVGWVRISDVTQAGMYLDETTQWLSQEGIRHSRPVASGSLIMSICATVGRPVITRMDTCIHDGFVVFDQLSVDQKFLYYVLCFIEQDWSRHGQTGSQMNLNTGLINSTVVPVPLTQEEQNAIATILSDMDADITTLEVKLAKARAIKQGMMQELLTGRIRLI